MRGRWFVPFAFAFGIVSMPTIATAQDPAPEPTTLEVGVQLAPKPELPDYAVATLRTVDGSPVGNAEVGFGVQTDFLGGRVASLGHATTDATGIARMPMTARDVEQGIVARFGGDESFAPSEASAVVRFPDERVVPVGIEASSSPLSSLRTVTPRVIGIVVAGLWLFFALATVYVVRSVRRGGEERPVEA